MTTVVPPDDAELVTAGRGSCTSTSRPHLGSARRLSRTGAKPSRALRRFEAAARLRARAPFAAVDRARLLVAIAAVSLGCAGPRATVEAARPVAPARASAATPPPARCGIEGTRAAELTVEVPGHAPFAVSVIEGAVRLTPTDDPTRATVRVRAPLRFEGVAEPSAQRLAVSRDGAFGAGGVRAREGAAIAAIETTPRGLEALLVLGRRIEGARHGLEVAVGPVRLACEDVRMAATAEPMRGNVGVRAAPGALLAIVARPPLVVRPVRVAPASFTVRPLERDAPLPVWVLDRHGADARVRVGFADESAIEGWVAESALRAPDLAEAERLERMIDDRLAESTGYDLLGMRVGTAPPAEPSVYEGAASLEARSEVMATPGEGVWAWSGASRLDVRVRWREGAAFAQLLEVPGLDLDPAHAWVRRAALELSPPHAE